MRKRSLLLQGVLLVFLISYLKFIWRPSSVVDYQKYGLLLPHNPVLLSEIANYVNGLKVDTVVILAPNHQDQDKLILSLDDNTTYMDQEYAWTIYRELFNSTDPRVKVEPYLFRRGSTLVELSEFAEGLKKKYSANNVLVIASVDFSHYTAKATAEINDKTTISLINNSNWTELIKLDSSYTDCPECLIVFCQLFNNCSKLQIDNRIYLDETSYLFSKIIIR